MEKTFDNDNFICFVELYEKTLTTCNRHGTVRGSDDLTEFIHEIRLYRQYQKTWKCVFKEAPGQAEVFSVLKNKSKSPPRGKYIYRRSP